MGYAIAENQTLEPLLFLLISSADHIQPKTGATPTVTISKNGAAFATPVGAVTEIGSGWYKVAGNASDSDTLGPLLLHATAAGADPTDEQFDVVDYNPSLSVSTAGPASSLSSVNVTALAIITRALKLLGVLSPGESVQSEDAADGLEALNTLVDGLGTQRLTQYTTLRTTKVLTAADGSYTIGVGGDIDQQRPQTPEFTAGIIPSGLTMEYPIPVLGPLDYQRIGNKTFQSAIPGAVFYTPDHPLAVLKLWPIPNSAATLVLYTPTALTQFADLATIYTLPNGYARTLHFNLAVELAPYYGLTPTPTVASVAVQSLADIKRVNISQATDVLRVDDALLMTRGSDASRNYDDWGV